jgi:Ca2+-binding EF-hand superfamily protein
MSEHPVVVGGDATASASLKLTKKQKERLIGREEFASMLTAEQKKLFDDLKGKPAADAVLHLQAWVGPGGGRLDISELAFTALAGKDKDGKTRDVIVVSEVQAPPFSRETKEQIQAKMVAYLKKTGAKTTQMTKEQFKGYYAEQQAERAKAMVKAFFARWDTTKDGKLSKEEVRAGSDGRSPLLADWDKYDKNKDGFIDLAEFEKYMRAQVSGRGKAR